MFLFFLSSGLFLGWSLGANDASNVFGTAVGSKMVRFRTAAICCSIFILLGAVIGIGLLKGGRGIRWKVLGGIGSSWVVTPIIAALISFISLFFLQNVIEQKTFRPVPYAITSETRHIS